MSHDEETEVRQRLRRLTETAVAPQPRPEVPLGVPQSSLAGALPADVLSSQPAAQPSSAGLAVPPESRLPGPSAFDPGRRGVRALAVVAAVVVVGAEGWAWQARPQSEPVAPLASDAASAAPAGDPSVSSSAEVVVAVAGKVRQPGLVRLPAGSRVADAVQAAGGADPGVDVAMLNPARKVVDGELIVVGVTPPPAPWPRRPEPVRPLGRRRARRSTSTRPRWRAGHAARGRAGARPADPHPCGQHGGFTAVGDLRQVDGIGDARYEQLKDLVTV